MMDLDSIARRLSTEIGRRGRVSIRTCRLGCVSYRPGRRLRVVYRVGIDGRELHVATSTFRSSSRGERAYRKAMATARNGGSLHPVVFDAELKTVFWTFPNDRRIENLSAVAEARDDLRHLVDGTWIRSRLVDYYPEASAVVQCLDESDRTVAYAKVSAGGEGECTLAVQSALSRAATGSRVRIARPLAYSKRHRTLLVEPIAGRPIGSLAGDELAPGLRAYGAGLATLHSLPATDDGPRGRDALGRLQRKAAGMRIVRPDLDEAIGSLLEELSERWARAAGDPTPIHGDTNENNAILQGDRIALIDFDRASMGAPGSDVGNFLGLQRYLRSIGLISPSSEKARAEAFKRGYESVRPLPHPEALQVHESAALAERAFRAVTRLRGSALPRVTALLAEAREMLG